MVFTTTLNQMLVMFAFIVIGFILQKFKILPENTAQGLSKLESVLLIPMLVLATFIRDFTLENLKTSYKFLLVGLGVALISVLIGIISAKFLSKDDFKRKIYTYVMAFSNFSYVGLPLVQEVFSEYTYAYLMFTLPAILICFGWGVNTLLIPKQDENANTFGKKVKVFLKGFTSPMVISIFVGMIIGVSGLKLPTFLTKTINSLRDCMSPIAMLLTGCIVAKYDLRKSFKDIGLYISTALRLLVIPIIAGLIMMPFAVPLLYKICVLVFLASPLGLNTVIVPVAYGKDTSHAAGLAIFSHSLSVLTIPLVLFLFL